MDGSFTFSGVDRLMVLSPDVTNLCKSWIVFRTFGLCDGLVRARILTGFKPWRLDQFNCFSFNPQFNFYDVDSALSHDEQKEQWMCFMDRWCEVTLFSPHFDVVDTAAMGLGIVVKHGISVSELAEELHGVLEFVELTFFRQLQLLRYNSLYRYQDEDHNMLYCVLFGPLSLVNSNQAAGIGFYNVDVAGLDLSWEMVYQSHTFLETFYGEHGDEVMSISQRYRSFNYHSIVILDDADLPVDDAANHNNQLFLGDAAATGMGSSPVQTSCLFKRVSFFYHGLDEEKVYVPGEEVFISYSLNDVLE